MRYRNRVLVLLSLLIAILMLDRVCISVAGPRIQEGLHIGPVGWGWVLGVFTLSYAFFEIPAGILGDRIGPRRVLTRIVLWWSIFTAMTGLVAGLPSMLAVRFLFGVGEAGGFPNASVVIARWFPIEERGRAFGLILMAGQLGGALAPLLVVPLQLHFGWRGSFWTFGLLGPAWAIVWFSWFRDSPSEKPGVTAAELAETAHLPRSAQHTMPWGIALRSFHVWATAGICLCYIYTYSFFSSWFHTYLVKARGFDEKDLWLSALPFIVAALANLCGGFASNTLVERIGLRWGRCAIGFAGLGVAGLAVVAVMLTHSGMSAILFLSVALGAITFQQPIMFAVCLDIGGAYSGAMVGIMNTSAGVGGFLSALAFGYLVKFSGGYLLPLMPMAALLFAGALLWLRVDPRQQIEMLENAPRDLISA